MNALTGTRTLATLVFTVAATYSYAGSVEFVASAETNALMPSIAHGMATTGTIQGYFYEAVQELTANPIEPANAARELAKAIRYGQYVIR